MVSQQQQQQQQQRLVSQQSLLLLLLIMSITLSAKVSLAWVPSSSQKSTVKSTVKSTTQTAKFFKTTATVIPEDAALAAATAIKPQTKETTTNSNSTASARLSEARKFPWMNGEGPDAQEENNIFLEHWNWQFSFFEENLTNLRVRKDTEHKEDYSDLYYATKENPKKKSKEQRCYTISLESDEYRDIRMTYIHCPAMQTFRCLSYPRNGDLPIMGMGIMKMGGVRNLAILDYQPLTDDNNGGNGINAAYTEELLKLHREIPSMGHSMTARHFDTNESRKYFTDFPLLGRSNDLEATEQERADYQSDLRKAQTRYVAKHTELTKAYTTTTNNNDNNNNNNMALEYVLKKHSDFDTHIAETEPARPFLMGVFGPEKGGKLVHNVIFPLSQNGTYGK